VHTTVVIDQIVDRMICKIGNLEKAYVTGSFARGVDSDTIELVLIGNKLDPVCIDKLVKIAEVFIHRRIMYLALTTDQMEYFFRDKPHMLIWEAEKVTA